jgi:hypothetical protein
LRGEGGQVGASSLERWRRKAEGCRHPSSQSSVAARGVQKNRLTEKTERTDKKLTEKTEPRKKTD